MLKKDKTVFVGMSGGVDSSVSAYLLKKQGYNVVGIHLRCWNRNGCDESEARDARIVADKLEIPFYVLDMEEEYKKQVVDYMIDSYRIGITPNPDVMCNKKIKFGTFLEKALKMGADYVATGHYVKLIKDGDRYNIYKAADEDKDQSYFLWTLDQKQLKHAIFPLGELKKSKVRNIAKKARLHVAEKKDSQGICFIGKVSLQDFLSDYLDKEKGNVLNSEGEVVGEHDGAHLYTIGQRHGLGVALQEPHYVSEKDLKMNTVTLASHEEKVLESSGVELMDVSIDNSFKLPTDVLTRIRYRQSLVEADLNNENDLYRLTFKQPVRFVAPGQSAVFYTKTGRLLGGGVIKKSI